MRKSPVAIIIILLVLNLFGASPASAATTRTLSGTVACLNGHDVMGIWVHSSGGGSGWAPFWKTTGGSAAFFRTTVTTSSSETNVRLSVGCGGTSGAWWSDNQTPYQKVAGSRIMNVRCSEEAGSGQRCSWPRVGSKQSTNSAYRGYCTWGAKEQWATRTGSYPVITGNAHEWNTSARANGWLVSTVPHRRSIVVFEPYVAGAGSLGHVAYVEDVYPKGNGVFEIYVKEMNALHAGGGFDRYNNYTYLHVPGSMNYIVTPNAS